MRLSKLEMQGFKSFAQKTELILADGVTAVIGPNGSGKSNLSDAVRWVLGEQSARALRGNKMEDVIFNGTAVKRPLSMCSVSLSFENQDRKLGMDCDEITVTRRAYRSGEGEYAINGKDCRLKDILDLFRDTGIGKDGYSIISQGRVDEILSTRTQDRREAIEEAVGLTKYRLRREEALKKLTQAKRNIERLEDILRELRSRLDPLKTESEKAKRSLELLESLKGLEINYFLRETEKNNARLETWEKILSECAETENANGEEDESLRALIEKSEAEIAGLESELSRSHEEQYDTLSAYEKLQSAINLEAERIRTAETDSLRLTEELTELKDRIKKNTELLSAKDNTDEVNITGLKEVLSAAETAYAAVCETVETAENELEKLKTSMMNNLNRIGQSRSDRSRLETMRESLLKRQEAIREELNGHSESSAGLVEEHEKELKSLREALTSAEKAEKEIRALETEQTEAERTKNTCQKELQQADSRLISAQSNLRILGDIVRKREGFQNSVRLLMNDASKDRRLHEAVIGLVAEMIRVPKEYETAIGTALGGALQYIIAPTGDDAKTIIEHVRQKQYGRVTVLPLDILRRYDPDSRLKTYLSRPGVLGVAKELISCEEKALSAIDFLLGRTLVVKDMTSALSLRREDKCFLQIVTLEGDMLQSSGVLSGGSKGKKSFDILSREREIAELERSVQELLIEKKKQESALRSAEERWKAAGALLAVRRNEITGLRLETERIKDKLEIIERDMELSSEKGQKLEEEYAGNADSLASIAARLETLSHEELTLRDSDSKGKREIIEKQRAVLSMRAERDNKLQTVTDARIALASAEKDELVLQREREKIGAESEMLRQKTVSVEAMIGKNAALAKASAWERERMGGEAEQISGALEVIRARIDSIQNEIADIKDEANKKRQRRDELLAENREIFERRSKTETAIGRMKTQQEQLADNIWQNYGLTYENALPFRFEAPVTNIGEKIASLKKQIREIGPVNPGSIQEYEEVSARFEELSGQLTDINNASLDLEDLIDRLTDTMEKTFREGFAKIRTEFAAVFSELFAGGKAELSLKDPSDVLNTEIEIIAQPPGKKLQLLSLMSGGERALTAIALLFAMLRIKSPSFCVLDEIETSLDEENVNRFASFLKQYGKETQFIVITHRKGSMEAANTIYGVSMEEKGISSIVSAKWEETA